MANETLNGLMVAILVTDGFEQVEMIEPRKALDEAGAETRLVSPKDSQVKAWKFTEWGDTFSVDIPLDGARPDDFDALLLPGGVINPDKLRMLPQAVAFAKAFFDAGKPVASICHGPWTIIEAGAARGRRLTSWPSLKSDLENAGAEWVDQEVVVDQGLVTSREPDDIPAFNREVIKLFASARGATSSGGRRARPAAAAGAAQHAPSAAGSKSMQRRPFGPAPREVAVIGQGTWYIDDAHRPTAVAALRRGLDLGMTHIDTAEMYGDAEIMVGEAITGRRDEVFLVSKVLPSNASRAGSVAACERSLARLRTDRLDCYLLHWPGPHPLEDTFAGFEQLRRDGKILSWGVSNFDVPELEVAWRAGGEGRLACNQVLYHLEERAIEHSVLPWCEAHGVAVVAYSPLGHGSFSGPRTPGGRVLEDIAARNGATARQVALHFLVRRPSLFAIPKASSPEHAADNSGAGALRLTEAELARIDGAFPLGPWPGHLPML